MSDDVREVPDHSDETAVSPKVITRRRALQVLGAVPVAAALGQQAPGQQQKPLTPGVTSQVPTAPTATPTAAAAFRPSSTSPADWMTDFRSRD